MSLVRKLAAVSMAALLALTAAACGDDSDTSTSDGAGTTSGSSSDAQYPITIEHALGTTVIEKKPERVATVQWANHEVPLALGVVPVGMAAANFGDPDGDGLLPWVADKLEELGAETPVLFDETDGIDFEAVADTNPDVILAAYSGLTQEDYETLSEIAPTIPYPEAPWATSWRDMIRFNSKAMGMEAEGLQLIEDIEAAMKAEVAKYPELEGKTIMFAGHIDPTDLSEIGFYTTADTRVKFFEDLGLTHADIVVEMSADSDKFSGTISAEQVDLFDDVDIIVSYGDEEGELLKTLQADPLASKIPALQRGSVVFFAGSTPLATAANPTPLAIEYVLADYVEMLAEAARKVG